MQAISVMDGQPADLQSVHNGYRLHPDIQT
jgi:hypothetical protein